jgi:hypothetical protein
VAAHVVGAVGVFSREIEEVDAGKDDEEAAEQGDGVYGGGGVEALEEEAGGDEGAGGEGDVVEGVDAGGRLVAEQFWVEGDVHVGGELAQGLVEVVHLREDAAYDHDDEDVGRGVGELVVAREGHLEGNAEGLDEHDGDRAGGGADGEVDQGVLAAVLGSDLVDHEDGEDGDEKAVNEEA